MSFGDIYESMKENGIPAGAAISILGIFGMGIQVYDESGKKKHL